MGGSVLGEIRAGCRYANVRGERAGDGTVESVISGLRGAAVILLDRCSGADSGCVFRIRLLLWGSGRYRPCSGYNGFPYGPAVFQMEMGVYYLP